MRHNPSPVFLLLLFGLLLTACAGPPQALLRQPIPLSLLTCPDIPKPSERMSDTELAYWILELNSVAAECRDKLIRVKELLAHE